MKQLNPSPGEPAAFEAAAFIQDWVPIETFCNRFPNIPESTIRWQMTDRHRNGLAPYVQVIGKKRYISIEGYAKWLELNAGATKTFAKGGVK